MSRDMSDPSTNQTTAVGWQSEPNIRGTYEILQSCLSTTALLCWSSVCPNVPALGSGYWRRISGKLSLFILSILMPEAVLFVAVGQLYRAWLDRGIAQTRGSNHWGLRECFFVNMGGLFIEFPPQAAGFPQPAPIPVDCRQLRYLIDNGFLEMPQIQPEQIEMRNKSNGLARTITVIQVLWFTITTLARVAQGLPITTLELTTLSLVLIMIFSAAAWWRKPMDIEHPIFVQCNAPLADVLAKMENPRNPRGRKFGATPLSFYNREEWVLSKAWASYTNILRMLCGGKKPSTAKDESTHTFSNAFPSIELRQVALGLEASSGLLTQVYSCVLLSAWNAYFPTPTERLLWRISTVAGVAFGFFGCAIAVLDRYGACLLRCCQYPRVWFRVLKSANGSKTGQDFPLIEGDTMPKTTRATVWRNYLCTGPDWLRRLSNLSPGHDPELDMKLLVWIPATLLCAVYCLARTYVIIEDIISLRQQPLITYEVVDWGRYLRLL
ncbi:hypothetical protein PWT90_00448 [Aphanocladium album]|nr:hypothetical protein PWT90_00448 [Aphanocladium album]